MLRSALKLEEGKTTLMGDVVSPEGGAEFEGKMMRSVLERSGISRRNCLEVKKNLGYANLGPPS